MTDHDKGPKKPDTEIPPAPNTSPATSIPYPAAAPPEAFNMQVTMEASFGEGMQKLAAVNTWAANCADRTVDKSNMGSAGSQNAQVRT